MDMKKNSGVNGNCETVTVLWFPMDDTSLTLWIQIFELQAALLARSSIFWNYKQAAIQWLRNFVKNDGNCGTQLERERSLSTHLIAIEIQSSFMRRGSIASTDFNWECRLRSPTKRAFLFQRSVKGGNNM
jgi:hypothetical protein